MIWIIDDDAEFAQIVERQLIGRRHTNEKLQIRHFTNAIEAINCQEVPDLIFLDILLDGPDGFTFLNELRSYEDLSKAPVVIMSSLNFSNKDLGAYGVVGYLNKSEMTPMDVMGYVRKYARSKD